jgi:prephenate dehydrogenase
VRLAVVGTGLIGASAALAARRAGIEGVTGWDEDRGTLDIAVERGAVERSSLQTRSPAPTSLLSPSVFTRSSRGTRAATSCTVTDVGSTGAVCAAAE